MMRVKYTLMAVILILSLSGCSTVKLMDSWQSKDFEGVKNKRILVAAKSPNLKTQKSYENKIVGYLKDLDIDALAIHEIFPDFEDRQRTLEKEKTDVVQFFKSKGITGIIVTSLKSTIETTNNDTSINIDIPMEYKNRSFITFNSGDDVHALPKLDPLDNKQISTVELKSTTYILEAITYDLTLEKEKQLVNVSLVEVTDPSSSKKILNKFSKLVVNQFN